MPLEVFIDLLDGSDGEDHSKGPDRDPAAGGRDAGNLLKQPDAEEENVRVLPELLVKEFREEC